MFWTRSLACLTSGVLGSALAVPGLAQVQADPTLGTLVNTSPTNACTGLCDITGGTVRGGNLFHSFQNFSLPSTNAIDIARFFVDPATQTVMVRVTGGTVSTLNGRILTVNAASSAFQPTNFFLLNPNGIVIGRNARIFVGGAFLASTADRLLFPDGNFPTNPAMPPLLTVTAPIGLGFTGIPQTIRMTGSRLFFPAPLTSFFTGFALVGGAVELDGVGIIAPDSRLEFGGVRSPGTVGLTLDQGQVSLTFPESVERADITVTNRSGSDLNSLLTVAGEGIGSMAFNGSNISIAGDDRLDVPTLITAGTEENLGVLGRQGGSITINATGQLQVNSAIIGNSTAPGSRGNSGNIEIRAGSVNLDQAFLNASQDGDGNAGNVVIQARGAILLNRSDIASNLGNRDSVAARGRVGEIQLEGRSVSFANDSTLQSGIFSGATATGSGLVSIRAEDVTIRGGDFAGIFTIAYPNARGNSSTIQIDANRLSLEGAQLSTSNLAIGNAGNIVLNVQDQLSLSNRTIVSSNIGSFDGSARAEGTVGTIAVTARNVLIDSSQIQAGFYSNTAGKPGTVSIKAEEGIVINSRGLGDTVTSGIFTNVEPDAIAQGSDIQFSAKRLEMSGNAALEAGNSGQGKAGNITLTIHDAVTLEGSQAVISSRLGSRGIGQGGTLNVDTALLTLDHGAQFNVSSLGQGGAGDLRISARTLRLDNGASLQSSAQQGDGGNIFLQGDRFLFLRHNSVIITTAGLAGSGGNGGNITIDYPFVISAPKENNDIIANAFDGRGGRISINALNLYWLQTRSREELAQLLGTGTPFQLSPRRLQTNDITAFSQNNPALNGQVVISTPDVDPSRGLATLPINLIDPSRQISQACTPGSSTAARNNRFVITGRGGLPASPESAFTGDRPLVELVSLVPSSADQATSLLDQAVAPNTSAETALPAIVEAQSWVKGKKGEITLIANATAAEGFSVKVLSCPSLRQ